MPDYKIRKPYINAFEKVLKHGIFILGQEVKEFEKRVSTYCGSKYSIAVSSGTDALILALKAYNISHKDEVIIPDMSFVATANAVNLVGAKPIFCDINNDFNINPKKINQLITSKTKAIILVHYAGKIAKIKKIKKIAKKYKIIVIEDASQAFGATYKKQKAGTIGDIGCFSLNPMKTLGALGEAGVITTDNLHIYNKLLQIRANGLNADRKCIHKGFNAKIDTIQAAFLNIKLDSLEQNILKRNKIATYYTKKLKKLVITPKIHKNIKLNRDVYYSYTILVKKKHRKDLASFLLSNNIEVKVNHTSMHQEPAYMKSNIKLKKSILISQQKIALPCNEMITKIEMKFIISKIKEFYKKVAENEL